MEGNLTFATRSIGLFWRENGSCSSRLKESQWVSEPLYGYFRRNRILDEGLRFLKRRSQCTMTATKPSKKCALVTQFFFRFFSRFCRSYGCTELTSSVLMQYDDFAWKTDDLIENARRNRRTQVRHRGGSRGRVQGVRTPPDMTCGFLIQLVFCKKKTMRFIGVEVEQETSAPPPTKNPGSAPAPEIRQWLSENVRTVKKNANVE